MSRPGEHLLDALGVEILVGLQEGPLERDLGEAGLAERLTAYDAVTDDMIEHVGLAEGIQHGRGEAGSLHVDVD